MSDDRHFTHSEKLIGLEGAYGVTTTALPTGARGKDVFVGIIDTGVNILHNAFMTTDATPKTRIHRYWVPHGRFISGVTPWVAGWGTWLKGTDLDNIIAQVRAGSQAPKALVEKALVNLTLVPDAATAETVARALLDLDSEKKDVQSSHGTAVASLAAGAPWRGSPSGRLFGGVAPEATLVVVAISQAKDSTYLGSLPINGDPNELLWAAGTEFCFDAAGAKPCAVNISLGHSMTPHNGKNTFHERVAAQARAGRIVITAAGNLGRIYKHARDTITAAKDFTIRPKADQKLTFFKVFASGADVKLSVRPPGQTTFTSSGTAAGYTVATSSRPGVMGDAEKHVSIHVTVGANAAIEAKDWTLRVEPQTPAGGLVDLWLETDGNDATDNLRFVAPAGISNASKEDVGRKDDNNKLVQVRPVDWIQHTLDGPGSGVEVVSVGGVNAVSDGGVSLYAGSSRGQPTGPARGADDSKPDLAAPSMGVRVASWKAVPKPMGRSGADIWEIGGTSSAAPFVTGAVALMLSHKPALTAAEIRKKLRDSVLAATNANRLSQILAILPLRDVNALDFFGKGILNIKAAVDKTVNP